MPVNLHEIISEVLDQVRGTWRFRWLFVGVAWAIALAGWAAVYAMPDVYLATAKVAIDRNSILGNATSGLTQSENLVTAVEHAQTELVTRDNLEDVARQAGLIDDTMPERQIEGAIATLRKNIHTKASRDYTFTISYENSDREKASKVVAGVLHSFVADSLGAQGEDVDVTERALRSELDDHEKRLHEAEEALAAFKKKNLGYMPDDSGDYYTRLQAALGKVRKNEQDLQQLEDRRDELMRQIGVDTSQTDQAAGDSALAANSCSQSQQIEQLKSQLSSLLVDYTEKHPRIITIRESIKNLQDQCDKEIAAAKKAGLAPITPEGDAATSNPVYENLRIQLSNAEVEIASTRTALKQARADVAQLRADVDKIGEVEVELKRLNRDYGVIQSRHQELLKRWEILQSRKRLDPMTKDVKFQVLESPYAGLKPEGPNRPLLLAAATIFALGAGLVAAFGLNQIRPVFFGRRAVSEVAGVAVLGAVSLFVTPRQRLRQRAEYFAWGCCSAFLLVMLVFVIHFAPQGSIILRDAIGISTA